MSFESNARRQGLIRDVRAIPLCPPGKIVQLVKTTADEPPAGCCSFGATAADSDEQSAPYAARWAHVTDFAEIIISSHFLDDHSSPNVLRELEGMAEVFGLSSPYDIQVSDNLRAHGSRELVADEHAANNQQLRKRHF